MKKNLVIFFVLIFMFSCSDSSNENINDDLIDLEDINLENNDFIINDDENNLIENTTDEDIDELIDILFDVN